jgi:hypothetical protein
MDTSRSKKTLRWRIADVFDFEVALKVDAAGREDGGTAAVAERNRKIFKRLQKENRWNHHTNRPEVFRQWLEERRKDTSKPGNEPLDSKKWPGNIIVSRCELTFNLLLILAIVFGGLSATAFFEKEGMVVRHLNVFNFLIPCVCFPFVFTVYSAYLLLRKSSARPNGWTAATVGWFSTIQFDSLTRWLNRSESPFEAARKTAIEKYLSGELHCLRPLFLVTVQSVGLGLAIGLAFSMAVVSTPNEVKCHWASTWVDEGDESSVASIVQVVSWPWRGLLGFEGGAPTVAEIELTRPVSRPKDADSMPDRSTADRAWVCFLLGCLLTYGVGVRLLLLILGYRKLRVGLATQPLNAPRHNTLWDEMEVDKRITTTAPKHMPDGNSPASSDSGPHEHSSLPGGQAAVIVVPKDLFRRCADLSWWDTLTEELDKRHQARPLTRINLKGRSLQDLESLKDDLRSAADLRRVIYVQDASRPPAEQELDVVRAIGEECRSDSSIQVLLIGRPIPDNLLHTPPRSHDLEAWRRKLATVLDRRPEIIGLVGTPPLA